MPGARLSSEQRELFVRRAQVWLVVSWGLFLAFWLARVYFELPADRVHVNHESHHYAVRVLEFRDLLGSGYLFPQWATHFRGGFGGPYFGYYQPGVFYAASLVPWWVSPNRALGLTVMAFSFVGYLSMWILVRRHWGKLSGVLAASLLLLSVYATTAIYVRGGVAEFAAMMLVVPALVAVDAWFRKGSVGALVGLASAGAAITVTHASVGLMTHALLGVGLLGLLGYAPARCRALGAGIALAAGVGLAAFYWFPVFFEWRLVSPNRAFEGFYDYANNFVAPTALLDTYRRDTLIPFTLGRLAVGLLLLNTVLVVCTGQRQERAYFALGWAGIALCTFMMSEVSQGIWAKIEPLQRLQFPWRLQTLTTILMAALAGAVPQLPWRFVRFALVAGVVATALGFSRDYTEYQVLARLRVPPTAESLIDSYIAPDVRNEWMPKGASLDVGRLRRRLPDSQGDVVVSNYQLRQGQLTLRVDSGAGGAVRLPHYYFPVGWRASLDGQPLKLDADAFGLMRIEIPQSAHGLLKVNFTMTPMRRWGLIVSGLTLMLGALFCVLYARRLKSSQRESN